jgi:hypothetical protein
MISKRSYNLKAKAIDGCLPSLITSILKRRNEMGDKGGKKDKNKAEKQKKENEEKKKEQQKAKLPTKKL